MANNITFLNMTGDITIEWDAENADLIKAMVEKKMKEGYSFFVLKPRLGGLLGHKRVEVTEVSQLDSATGAGAVSVPDALAEKMIKSLNDNDVGTLVANKKAKLVSKVEGNVHYLDTSHRAKSAEEVVSSSESVAVRRLAGG